MTIKKDFSKKIRFIKVSILGLLLSISFLSVSCAPKGVICSKGTPEERTGYQGYIYLGTQKPSKVRKSLCTGDIDRILMVATSLTPFQKIELRDLTCGDKASVEGFNKFFNSLDDATKADLIRAFATYGYYIHGYG